MTRTIVLVCVAFMFLAATLSSYNYIFNQQRFFGTREGLIKEWVQCCQPKPPALEKVTAKNFSFNDYGVEDVTAIKPNPNDSHGRALKAALEKLLPVGTPQETADKFLQEKSYKKGTVKADKIIFEAWIYNILNIKLSDAAYPGENPILPSRHCHPYWIIEVTFDRQKKLKNLELQASCTEAIFH